MQAISCNARFDPAPLHKEDAAAAAQDDNYFVLFHNFILSICFFSPPAVRFAVFLGGSLAAGAMIMSVRQPAGELEKAELALRQEDYSKERRALRYG